ncbi:MAG: pyruvate dehydrogenase complex dihydrolipoamide acetyltransferase [Longimicrobiales bacterium]
MITKVHMEALSPTMEEGQLVRWLKSEGDAVSNGDVLAEIETDKATMELVARGDGTLRKIFLGEGGTAPVGEVIAVIADEDEDISGVSGASGGSAPSGDDGSDEKDEKEKGEKDEKDEKAKKQQDDGDDEAPAAADERTEDEPTDGDEGAARSGGDGGRVKASPLARRLADDLGVDLGSVEGSGPGGRVVKRDVEEASERAEKAPAASGAPAWSSDEAEYEDVPISQMRKTIAKRLVQSIGPVPHFFLTIDVDMGRVMEARKSINAMLEEEGRKVSINDLVLKATAAALKKHPNCNAHWMDGKIRRFNAVHLGVAVAVEDGLITPVVRHAHAKGIAQIGDEVREMAGRAREKKLKPEEYTGATFSVSNLGMFGIHEFTAIINPPEAGILAVGGIEDTPVVVDGQVVVRPRMRITMSCDHRVIDGAQGSRFLQTLKAMLEEPTAIVV